MDLMEMYASMTIVAKAVAMVLIIMSMWSLGVGIERFFTYQQARNQSKLYAPQVAKAYVAALRDILRALGVSDVKMEQGSLRCDANISVRKAGAGLGTRCEIKNVNSVKNIIKAIVRYFKFFICIIILSHPWSINVFEKIFILKKKKFRMITLS